MRKWIKELNKIELKENKKSNFKNKREENKTRRTKGKGKNRTKALEKQQKVLIEDNIQRTKMFDEFVVKIKTLKETFDLGAISQEEYDEISKFTFP